MKQVVIYYLPDEKTYAEDFAWRRAAGIKIGRMVPYDSAVGDCEVQIVVESEEQLLMMKIRHPRARVTDFYAFYGVPNEDAE